MTVRKNLGPQADTASYEEQPFSDRKKAPFPNCAPPLAAIAGVHLYKLAEYSGLSPVYHHGRELPVVLDGAGLLVVPDLVGDHLDLLEDEGELPGDAEVGLALLLLLSSSHKRVPWDKLIDHSRLQYVKMFSGSMELSIAKNQ